MKKKRMPHFLVAFFDEGTVRKKCGMFQEGAVRKKKCGSGLLMAYGIVA